MAETSRPTLVSELLSGDHAALAKTITAIENREPGYRDLISALYRHTGNAEVIGITGSPGAGKSTLVDKLAEYYREEGMTVGVIAVDPSSPFSGGAVLGDRIRMGATAGDMEVFFRSMSARGNLGGLSMATADAVTALDAFGKDVIIVETVGAGQNEVEVVKTADTVAVLVPPSSGDDVQMLKAGILEIADVFVVNKADLQGADRTVQELRSMLDLRDADADDWDPEIVETVATDGTGLMDLIGVFEEHDAWLERTGRRREKRRKRYAAEIRTLLRDDAAALIEREIESAGGIERMVDAVENGETDPYELAADIMDPLADCVDRYDH